MGWGRNVLLEDLGEDHPLHETLAEIEILRHRLNKSTTRQASVADELRRVAAENCELKLYVATLFRVLVDKQVVTPEELTALVTAIDTEDGATDGRHAGPVLSR